MAAPEIRESEVERLLGAKKFIHRTTFDRSSGMGEGSTIEVEYDIRRKDSPTLDLKLRLWARQKSPKAVKPSPRPGVALYWRGKRIRGIDWKLKEDVRKDGFVTGEVVRHWHEHRWTDLDEDRVIANANKIVKQEDFWSVVRTCLKRWNIEDTVTPVRSTRLFGGKP